MDYIDEMFIGQFLNHNFKLKFEFHNFMGITVYFFRNSLEKPQITKENEIGEFGVHLCVPGYIDPSVPHRSTGLNGENEERVLHSMLEGGVCTKRDGLSDFDVQQEKQGMYRTLLKNIFPNSQIFKVNVIFVISTFY